MRDMIQRPESMDAPRALDPESALGVAKGIDVRKYFYMIAKRLWLLLLCFMTSIVIMLVMMARQIPEYQATAKMHLMQLADEIIANLVADPNAQVRVTLEISAQFEGGAQENTKRSVSENATALKLKSANWE